MRERIVCLPAMVMAGVLTIAAMVPAVARNGTFAAGFRPAFSSHKQHARRPGLASLVNRQAHPVRPRIEKFNRGPIVVWPYPWVGDTIPVEVPQYGDEDRSAPPVIVVAGSNGDARAAASPPDYSYIAGCHATPNGYHCDIPHPEAAQPDR